MRINKFLAHKGYSTRRGADELVEKKKVFINGELALLGSKINEGDVVEVRRTQKPKEHVYYAYNKPRGVITHSPQRGEKDVVADANLRNVFPVGRLDKESRGLMILTNDGRITDRLLNPDYVHEKEYIVETTQKLRESFKDYMEAGVKIDDYVTKPCVVKIMGERSFRIVISEGKKHQIRRMVVAMHNEVADLERVRVMNIALGKLPLGSTRPIVSKELETFLQALGL
ncbi:MAG: hypothetical protein A2542_00945 [Parcubacteria group bacterium RIFOXYD2_FULL_52_8]|nr:MAG: hypothetical protein A2542_00945 [Parcubacteria group bacterium RIFOXYD2_FULL_52_8]